MTTKCPQADNWCTTEFEAIKTSFKWIINNFSGCPKVTGHQILSSTFGSPQDMKTKWRLILNPYGYTEEFKEDVSVFLYLEKSSKSEVLAEFDLKIVFDIDSNQQILEEKGIKRNFEIGESYGCPKIISKKALEKYKNRLLPNDVLTIYCEVTTFGECKTIGGQKIGLKRSDSKLSDDMTTLYENPNYCDVEIVVKGHVFCAHKAILMARSPVFAAMFKHPMKESQQNKVVINDIEKEVFGEVLRFIYTDTVINEDINSSIKLLTAADKYNLDQLKSICEEHIGSHLNVKSVSEVLILADNHSAEELKAKAIDFIEKNRNEVMKTKGWIKVMKRSELLNFF